MRRIGGDRQAGAAGDRQAGRLLVVARHWRRRPARLQIRRHPGAELAQVPRPGDEDAEEPGGEVLVEVCHLALGVGGSEILLEEIQVEAERLSKCSRLEIAPLGLAPEQRGAALEGQDDRRLPLVERQQQGVAAGAGLALEVDQGAVPVVPVMRRRLPAGGAQTIAAEEQQPGVDVPGHRPGAAVDPVGGGDAGKLVGVTAGQAIVQRSDGTQRHQLGHPGGARLEDIRHRAADERGEQLLVGGAPGDLLDPHPYLRMGALERRQELLHHLPFPAHRPETQLGDRRCL